MVKILVDTSVWLALAADPKDVALVAIIEKLIDEGLVELLVPRTVLNEFLAHRDRVAMDHGKRLSSHFRTVKDAVQISGADAVSIERTLRLLDEVDQNTSTKTKVAARTFNGIEKVLKLGTPLEPSQAVKLAVFERAFDQRAPFHQGKNEIADAVIIETYAECVRDGRGQDGVRWMFVTRNVNDFSASKTNEKTPHPDFACFDPGRSDYFINLPDALRSVDPVVVGELMHTWELEQPTIGELINRYIAERSPPKSTTYPLTQLRDSTLGKKIAAKLHAKDIVDYCRTRREKDGIVPTTIRQPLIYLRSVLNAAENEWEVLGVSTDVVDAATQELEALELIGHTYELQGRRPAADELDRLVKYFERQDKISKVPMLDVMHFALATGRRRDEIFKLRWEHYNDDEQTCVLDGKRFPLQDEAVEIIRRQGRTGEFIFPYLGTTAGQRFTQAKRRLGIKGFRFQDLRREAVMRMLAANVPLDRIERLTGMGALSLSRYRAQFAAGGDAPPRSSDAWTRVRKLRFKPKGPRSKTASGALKDRQP
jgi:integrase